MFESCASAERKETIDLSPSFSSAIQEFGGRRKKRVLEKNRWVLDGKEGKIRKKSDGFLPGTKEQSPEKFLAHNSSVGGGKGGRVEEKKNLAAFASTFKKRKDRKNGIEKQEERKRSQEEEEQRRESGEKRERERERGWCEEYEREGVVDDERRKDVRRDA